MPACVNTGKGLKRETCFFFTKVNLTIGTHKLKIFLGQEGSNGISKERLG